MKNELTIKRTDKLTIKFDNVLLEQNMKFTAKEKDIFFLLCAVLRERGTEVFDIPFKDIKRAINAKTLSNLRLSKIIESMGHKLLHSTGKITTENGFSLFVLFTDMDVDIVNGTLTISINPKYSYLLNDLISNYTSSDFLSYLSLKSKYAKDLYFWLLRWKYAGMFIVSSEEVRSILNVPSGYRDNDIREKIIEPAMKELSNLFEDLKVKEIRKTHKRGGPSFVERYIFTFKPFKKKELLEETVIICPECGGHLIQREMNNRTVYCHKDGAHADAECHAIFEEYEIDDLLENGDTKTVIVKTDRPLNE